jgi:hypothetical protein
MGAGPQMWSVGLVIDEAEIRSLSDSSIVMYILKNTDGHMLRFKLPSEAGGLENLRLELNAQNAREAEDRAVGIIETARRAAKLPDAVVPVAWVTPVRDTEIGSNFLDEAKDLIESEQFQMAVVAADIHLEVQAKAMIERAVDRMAPAFADVLLQHRASTNINRPEGQAMIKRFLSIDLTSLKEWQAFKAHAGRRNAIVHEGLSIDEAEAAASISAVHDLWLRLGEVWRTMEAR